MKIFWFLLFFGSTIYAQYECANPNFSTLEQLVGTWDVRTTDRTRPGEYEENTGTAEITVLFAQCAIEQKYTGIFKEKDYAFKSTLICADSTNVQAMWLDSNHGRFMTLAGEISPDSIVVRWQREFTNRTMIVKHKFSELQKNSFQMESFLSPNSGTDWQLTHRRVYTRRN